MTTTYFPLLGMNYILNDTAQIIDYKMDGVQRIKILLCAQPNSYPHFGTLLNFILAFSYAQNVQAKYGVKAEVILDLLEQAKGAKFAFGESAYFKPLKDTYRQSKAMSDYEFYRTYFEELLAELSALSGVPFYIRTYNEFQKDKYARRTLIQMYNHYEDVARLISPKERKLRARVACPVCGLYSTNALDTDVAVEKDRLIFTSVCPLHGGHKLVFSEDNSAEPNPNVPMRNLMRGVSIIENDKIERSLSIIFEGADWGDVWPLRVYYEGLKVLGYSEIPTLIYTPQVLDESGSKLSKRMYVGGDEAYKKMYDEYVVNISLIKDSLGENAIKKLWDVFSGWATDPKYFFRDYTVDYLLSLIKEETT